MKLPDLPWKKKPAPPRRVRPTTTLDSDAPISLEDDDRLGRRTFAARLAQQVELAPATGFVVALVGPWGSGKTSVLRMVERRLAEPQSPEGPSRVVVRFDPWLVSGSEHLISQFFEELAAALPRELGPKRGTKIAERLRGYSAGLRMLERAPGVGWILGLSGAALDEAGRRVDRTPGSLQEQREQTREALLDLGVHIVVLIDDVDRLEDAEIRDLMRMVKLVGDFPNVTYLLAFDRDAVRNALAVGNTDGGEYLEKIVQIEYRLPEPPPEMLEGLLVEGIDRATEAVPNEGLDRDRWEAIYRRIIRPLVSRPRHAARFANALPLAIALAEEEVDVADVIALTALQTLLPGFHDGLVDLRDDLTPQLGFLAGLNDSKKKQESAERLKAAAEGSGNPPVAYATYELLFPSSQGALANTYTDEAPEWKRARRVADREPFDTYFTATLPEGALSVAEVREVLSAFATSPEALDAVIQRHGDEDLPALLQRVWVHIDELDLQKIEAALPVLDALAVRLSKLDDDGLWSPGDRVRSFTRDLVERFPAGEKREAVVKQKFAMSRTLTEKFMWLRSIGAWEVGRDDFCTEETKHALRLDLATQVLESDPEALVAEQRPGWLLHFAEDDGGEGASERIGELIEDGRLLPAYLSAFMALAAGSPSHVLRIADVMERQGRERLVAALPRIDVSNLAGVQRDAVVQLSAHLAEQTKEELDKQKPQPSPEEQ